MQGMRQYAVNPSDTKIKKGKENLSIITQCDYIMT